MDPNDRRRKVKRRKEGGGKKKKRKIRNNRSVKMNVPRRCWRPGYRDRFIKRWKSFVSAGRGRVAINCNKKQKRYGHLVQRFRSPRQPLIDIYSPVKANREIKNRLPVLVFGVRASTPSCPFQRGIWRKIWPTIEKFNNLIINFERKGKILETKGRKNGSR